jgi:hypothetical protein
MPDDKRNQLEIQLQKFSPGTLDAILLRALDKPLQYFVIADNIVDIVFRLLNRLEQEAIIMQRFLVYVWMSSPEPELQSAISNYYGFKTPNPYDSLLPYGKPIVDRLELKKALKELFVVNGQLMHRGLIVYGPRYTGRTHAAGFISYVINSAVPRMLVTIIDLAENSLEDILYKLKEELQIPVELTSDPGAQLTRQIKNFPSTIAGHLKHKNYANPGNSQRWCLIFDHYDREEVQEEARVFVDDLVRYVGENTVDFWIIVLGHKKPSSFYSHPYILEPVEIEPIKQADLHTYLTNIYAENKKVISPEELNRIVNEILTG